MSTPTLQMTDMVGHNLIMLW